jgi:hypothetical protein
MGKMPIEIIEELTDPSGTDDEKNVDDYYNFNIIEEDNDEFGEIKENKPRVRKHQFLNKMKKNFETPKLVLGDLGRKGSFKSEYYRTPRNDIKQIDQEDFLNFSPEKNLNSIQEVVQQAPKLNSKKEKNKIFSNKRLSLEKTFKFEIDTEDEGNVKENPKMTESSRKLQNNIKMEFLEDIKFGSSIFNKGSIITNQNHQILRKSSNSRRHSPRLRMEMSMVTSELLKKKEFQEDEKEFLNLDLSDKET